MKTLALAFVSSCAFVGGAPVVNTINPANLASQQPEQGGARYFVDANASAYEQPIAEGARLLAKLGWSIERTTTREQAQITFALSPEPCAKGKDATTGACGDIRLCATSHALTRPETYAHELGHTLGAQHTAEGVFAVMSPKAGDVAPRFTNADVAQFNARVRQGSIFARSFDGSALCKPSK